MLPLAKVQTALQKQNKNWQRIIHNVAVASLHSDFYVEPHGSTWHPPDVALMHTFSRGV